MAVKEAKDRWRATKGVDEIQNHAFNQLGVDLWKARMDTWDIRAVLHEELAYANHPDQRRRQIKPIVEKLGGWNRNG